jgi:hypothetical protein
MAQEKPLARSFADVLRDAAKERRKGQPAATMRSDVVSVGKDGKETVKRGTTKPARLTRISESEFQNDTGAAEPKLLATKKMVRVKNPGVADTPTPKKQRNP